MTLRTKFKELTEAAYNLQLVEGPESEQFRIALHNVHVAVHNSLGFDLNDYTRLCHHASVARGWWKHPENGADILALCKASPWLEGLVKAQKLALVHSEVSEGLEGERKGLMDDKLPHRRMTEVELADALIRIFDYAGAFGYDLEAAVKEKMEFNVVRTDHDPENRKKEGGKSF